MEERACLDMVFKKGDREYHFIIPNNAPIGEVYDITFEILGDITERAKKAAEAAKPKEAEEVKADLVA